MNWSDPPTCELCGNARSGDRAVFAVAGTAGGMTPYYADDWLTVWQGDCREVMAQMEPESVHCVVTSPPYWGLRDYGVDGALGLETTPEEYVANMVAVFREVRRVLRNDGTCWVNLGDSYGQNQGPGFDTNKDGGSRKAAASLGRAPTRTGLKPKDLVGIPWRVAFALQADGWYLRSDIIWAKPNPMPESVADRPTKAHEYVFLLSKSARYYYDADAVREAAGDNTHSRGRGSSPKNELEAELTGRHKGWGESTLEVLTARNLRSVWSIATQPYPGAHFATFPEKLVEPCVKAGTSERGVCPECGAPWRRVVEMHRRNGRDWNANNRNGGPRLVKGQSASDGMPHDYRPPTTTGWQPSCAHDGQPVPATILDPFAGSGTTGRVAQRLGRRAVLIDLSGEYLVQAMARNRDIPLSLSFSPAGPA